MAAGPESEDPDVPEWILGAGVLFGLNRIQTRWKILAIHRKWRSFRRELEPASRRFEHQICGECGALQPHEAKTCSSCGEKLASAPARFLKSLGLSMPAFLSVSSLLWLAFIAIYFRMMVEWKGQGLMSWDTETLIAHGALWPPAFWEGQYWRVGTANFLHIGWLHVFFNTAGLSQVGPAIEDVYGRGRMVFFFILTGILAMLASAIFNPGALTAGASGALMGLIGVAAGWGHRSKTTHGRNVRDQMIKWGVYTMLFGLVMNANHVAHAAGFIAGAIIGYAYPTHTLEKTKGSAVSIGLGILGGLTCGVLALLALVPPGASRELAAEFREPELSDEDFLNERDVPIAIANACRLRDNGNISGALLELGRADLGDDDPTEAELDNACAFHEVMKKECALYHEGGLDAVHPLELPQDYEHAKEIADAITDNYRYWCGEETDVQPQRDKPKPEVSEPPL